MCKKQHLTHFRSLLAIATIAVGLVAGQSVPAAAHVGVAMQPDRAGREQMPMHRNVNYAPVRPARTYASYPPPDYCDLPSAGCESYLSN
jgi:hypothetical protein